MSYLDAYDTDNPAERRAARAQARFARRVEVAQTAEAITAAIERLEHDLARARRSVEHPTVAAPRHTDPRTDRARDTGRPATDHLETP